MHTYQQKIIQFHNAHRRKSHTNIYTVSLDVAKIAEKQAKKSSMHVSFLQLVVHIFTVSQWVGFYFHSTHDLNSALDRILFLFLTAADQESERQRFISLFFVQKLCVRCGAARC